MRGAMKLPSICCTARIIIRNSAACRGDSSSNSSTPGTAPKNGPSTGTMLVAPTITAISGA